MIEITKRIFVFRSLPFSSDARTSRHALLFGNEYDIRFICWGNTRAEYGASSFALPRKRGASIYMALGYALFSLYISIFVLRFVRKTDICIFMDLETALPALLFSKLKGAFSIFDIVDPFFLVKPVRPIGLFCWLEERVAEHAHLVFIPNEMRRTPYQNKLQGAKVVVVENVPSFAGTDRLAYCSTAKSYESEITLGYFGGLEHVHRGLEDILLLVTNNPRFRLVIGGTGELADDISAASLKCERITFVGPYDYATLPFLVSKIDIMVGLYYRSKELHCYASPNKFYEHFYFGKPILTSARTPFAETVKKMKSGWTVDDGYVSLSAWCVTLTAEGVAQYAKSAGNAWGCVYEDYYKNKRIEIRECLSLYDQGGQKTL